MPSALREGPRAEAGEGVSHEEVVGSLCRSCC